MREVRYFWCPRCKAKRTTMQTSPPGYRWMSGSRHRTCAKYHVHIDKDGKYSDGPCGSEVVEISRDASITEILATLDKLKGEQ